MRKCEGRGVLNVKSILREKGEGRGDSFELRTYCVVSCKRLTKPRKKIKKKARGGAGGTARTFDTWGG